VHGAPASSVGRWLGAALTRRPRAAEPPPPASVDASVTAPLAAVALPLPRTAQPLTTAHQQVRDEAAAKAKPRRELPVRRRLEGT